MPMTRLNTPQDLGKFKRDVAGVNQEIQEQIEEQTYVTNIIPDDRDRNSRYCL